MISREDVAQKAHDVLCDLAGEHHTDMCPDCTRAIPYQIADAILALIQERIRELDAAWLRHTWPCGHISEGTGDEPDRCRICVAEARARNAEALAANLRRVDNERAIELMRVKRDLITVRDAAEGRG